MINREINPWLANYSCDDVEIMAELEKEFCALATDLSAYTSFYFSTVGNQFFN